MLTWVKHRLKRAKQGFTVVLNYSTQPAAPHSITAHTLPCETAGERAALQTKTPFSAHLHSRLLPPPHTVYREESSSLIKTVLSHTQKHVCRIRHAQTGMRADTQPYN